jgi:ketosteroid isomerase-like protein
MGGRIPLRTLTVEIEALKNAYAALNRGDIAAFVSVFDPQVERIEWPGLPQAATYLGLAAVTAHVSKARGTWAEGGCEPTRLVAAPSGDRVIVFVRVRVRLKHETEWREGRTTDVYTFRNGKVVEFRTFADERQALAWAGTEASGAD